MRARATLHFRERQQPSREVCCGLKRPQRPRFLRHHLEKRWTPNRAEDLQLQMGAATGTTEMFTGWRRVQKDGPTPGIGFGSAAGRSPRARARSISGRRRGSCRPTAVVSQHHVVPLTRAAGTSPADEHRDATSSSSSPRRSPNGLHVQSPKTHHGTPDRASAGRHPAQFLGSTRSALPAPRAAKVSHDATISSVQLRARVGLGRLTRARLHGARKREFDERKIRTPPPRISQRPARPSYHARAKVSH